jgi:NAD(P)H dehydrogenase (quinone)
VFSGLTSTETPTQSRSWLAPRSQLTADSGPRRFPLPSGDKQSTLMSMFVFSMQHGLLWVGNPILRASHSDAVWVGILHDDGARLQQ